MKRTSLTTLILSSFLTTSTVFASDVLSDASNGLIPEDIKKDGAKLQKWQDDNMEKLTARAELHGLIYDQVERLFAPFSRKGSNQTRAIANAVCDYLEQRANKSQYLAELFDGHRGLNVKVQAAEKMSDGGLPQTGRHVALIRAISTMTDELKTIKTKLEAQPKLIEEWTTEITRLKKESAATDSTMRTLKEKASQAEALLKKAEQASETEENNFIALQKEMELLESQVTELQQKSREEIQKASPEPTAEIATETKSVWRASLAQLNEDKKTPEELLEAMREALPKYMEAKKLSRNEKDKKAEELAGIQNEVESNGDAYKKLLADVKALEEKIEGSKIETEKLTQRRTEVLAEQKNLQEAADRYALVKYLTYLNLYSALPNDSYDYNGFKEAGFAPLSTLSPHTMPVTLKLVNVRAADVAMYNAREVAKREVEKLKTIYEKQAEKAQQELEKKAAEYIYSKVSNSTLSSSMSSAIAKSAKDYFDIKNSFSFYQQQQGNHNYYAQKMDLIPFVQESSKTLDPLRADRQIKNSMDKWSTKISGGKDALTDRLGLNSALFNKSFAIQTLPHMLSFNELAEAFPDVQYVSGKDSQIWSVGKMQLKVNYFDSFVSQDALAHQRVDPIYAFVVEKAKAQSLKKVGEKFDVRIQAVKQESPEHEALITHAFLKTISYMNMTYALTHDENGNKLPELKLIDPVLEQFIKEPLPRLDHVMATRALKWGQRVKQHGETFINDHGLEAHIFTPVEIVKK